jgi:hypothetical protein
MLFQLLGTLVMGVAAVGVVLLGWRLVGRRPPPWVLPVAAGLAMLGFHVWNEYSWFRRTAAALPPHMVVAAAHASSSPLQPWTLLLPRVQRFAVIDLRAIHRNGSAPGLRMVEVFLIERHMPTFTTTQIFDCDTPRRADVTGNLEFDADGRPVDAEWIRLDAADQYRRSVCAAAL